ncbi:hypothetical protein QFC20_007649 [Naganishia adeliensis]|uniref:Uncharacterized protein n=1 Tax=Naganishia adeliensis TaxID=92952 RepID=A0ACC2UWZ2_9TREE|nr:hypothetical protein QFC20_007649 [Naganishia adeliensis]
MSGLRRVYIGKLAPDLFRDFKIRECRLMAGFGFVEFEDARDAEEAVSKFDGAKLLGEPIMVEFAKERRPREGMDPRGPPGGYGGPPGGGFAGAPRRGPGVKVLLKGIGSDVSWQDFGREAGRPLRSDVDRTTGDGFLEYGSQEEAQVAVEKLSQMEIRGRRPECAIDTEGTEGTEGTEVEIVVTANDPTAGTEEVTGATAGNDHTAATEAEIDLTAATEAEIDLTAATEAATEVTLRETLLVEDTLLDENTNRGTEALLVEASGTTTDLPVVVEDTMTDEAVGIRMSDGTGGMSVVALTGR